MNSNQQKAPVIKKENIKLFMCDNFNCSRVNKMNNNQGKMKR